MKRSALAVAITTSFTLPFYAIAADNIADELARGSNLEFADQIGGTVGTSFEYEYRTITNVDGSVDKETIQTNEIGQIFMRHSEFNLSGFYSLKTETSSKREENGYYQKEDGYRHLLNINKGFGLSNGFNAALIYEAEYFTTKRVSEYVDHTRGDQLDQYIKPTLYYWNPEMSFGFDTYVEFLFSSRELPQDQPTDEMGYSFVFKPYYRTGNWELGAEMFHQIKDIEIRGTNGDTRSIDKEFTETYVEPYVSYSFEDAGVLYTRLRVGENEETVTSSNRDWNGSAVGDEYYKDIMKATVGYEQAVGDNWLVKAEYEFNKDDETFNYMQGEKTVESDKFYVHALYRF